VLVAVVFQLVPAAKEPLFLITKLDLFVNNKVFELSTQNAKVCCNALVYVDDCPKEMIPLNIPVALAPFPIAKDEYNAAPSALEAAPIAVESMAAYAPLPIAVAEAPAEFAPLPTETELLLPTAPLPIVTLYGDIAPPPFAPLPITTDVPGS
jgi:hypothetical protein